jgi:uncharacterized protein (TIGR04255 family)
MVENPFDAEPVEEVHLARAPLVHVVAQVRFPKVLALATDAGVAPVQEALVHRFPVLQQDQTMGVLITPNGVTSQPQADTVWRLQTRDNDWQVSIGTSFISLDTTAYVSRADFCDRLVEVLEAFRKVVNPVIAERVGMRYVDRLDDPDQLSRLGELVRAEILGGYAVPLPDGVALRHSICESVFTGGDNQVLARWGMLPPNAVLDPVIVPSERQSWVLDVDVFRDVRMDFDHYSLTELVREFADQSYRFFRWAVTDALLAEAGGQL